jgi:hypothetical protein
MLSNIGEIRSEIIRSVDALSQDDLLVIRQSLRLSTLRRELRGVDITHVLPGDTISCIGSFLDASSVARLQQTCRTVNEALDSVWRDRGALDFDGIIVDGERFVSKSVCGSWYKRYVHFTRSLCIFPRRGVLEASVSRKVRTFIPPYRKVSCTLPATFSILTAGRTFVEMTVSVRFSPDAVRSVIGLIEAPIKGGPESLLCDRGLSRTHWGLAYGPLTGVCSVQGRYYDDFSTYRARHGLTDYLSLALENEVSMRVAILIENGMVAFYRLPVDSDYVDWECTGFVYEIKHAHMVHPCMMFSSIGSRDSIALKIDRVSRDPPYYPHINEKALRKSSWNSFAEEGLDAAAPPPPNTPVLVSQDIEMEEMI